MQTEWIRVKDNCVVPANSIFTNDMEKGEYITVILVPGFKDTAIKLYDEANAAFQAFLNGTLHVPTNENGVKDVIGAWDARGRARSFAQEPERAEIPPGFAESLRAPKEQEIVITPPQLTHKTGPITDSGKRASRIDFNKVQSRLKGEL